MDYALPLAGAIACGLAGGYGRHIQGGAPGTRRWQAMALYVICCAPALWVYGPDWWQGTLIAVALIAAFYINMTVGQEFDNLWLGCMRYTLCFAFLAAVCGTLWVLAFAPPVFLVLKWAKEPHEGDPHVLFEEVLGFCTGAAWGLAPLIRGW